MINGNIINPLRAGSPTTLGLTVALRISSWYLTTVRVLLAITQRSLWPSKYMPPQIIWPTSQSIMLDDVTSNNRQFLHRSCVLMNHQWREQGNSGGSANSDVHWKMWITLNGAGQWAEVLLQTVDPHDTLFETLSHRLVRNMHTRTPTCSFSHKRADSSPIAGLMPFNSTLQLSLCSGQSPGISSLLLRMC